MEEMHDTFLRCQQRLREKGVYIADDTVTAVEQWLEGLIRQASEAKKTADVQIGWGE